MSSTMVLPNSLVGRADSVPSSFSCSCTDSGFGAAWVRVAGELDMATAPDLERTLHEAHSRARVVVLDLRELSFTDSSGLHAIVSASARAQDDGRRLVLLRAPPDIDHAFQMIRSCDALEVRDVDPVEAPVYALQRSLVALSLLRSGEAARRKPSPS